MDLPSHLSEATALTTLSIDLGSYMHTYVEGWRPKRLRVPAGLRRLMLVERSGEAAEMRRAHDLVQLAGKLYHCYHCIRAGCCGLCV